MERINKPTLLSGGRQSRHTEQGSLQLSFIAVVFALIFLFLPSTNNTLDSLAYARYIREGTEILSPHHLLYHLPGYLISRLWDIDQTLPLLCALNAIGAALCLWLSGKILVCMGWQSPKSLGCALIALGSCFGFMRFATDAETYILPLLWALAATLMRLKQRKKDTESSALSAFGVALLMAAACLFHQIYFFWYVGLGIDLLWRGKLKDRLQPTLGYALGGSTVLLVYALCYRIDNYTDAPNFLTYIFYDYYTHNEVGLELSSRTILLGLINLLRSFVQVHGYIPYLLRAYPVFAIGLSLSSALLLYGLVLLWRERFLLQRKNSWFLFRWTFTHTLLLIFSLQWGFAIIGGGNAEFMTMLPFLLLFAFASIYKKPPKAFFSFSVAIALWNLSTALVPAHFLQLSPVAAEAKFIRQNPDAQYFLKEDIWIRNYFLYHFPEDALPKIKPIDSLPTTGSPATPAQDYNRFQKETPDLKPIYTDRNSPTFLSRAKLLQSPSIPIRQDRIERTDTLAYSIGYSLIEEVRPF